MTTDLTDTLPYEQIESLIDSWGSVGQLRLSDHCELEISQAVHAEHQLGEPPPLEEDDPVPGCTCLRCQTLAAGGDPEDVDVARFVVGILAKLSPQVRRKAANRAKTVWEEDGVTLPSATLLADAASDLPGAQQAPSSSESDEDREHGGSLPIEEARRTPILEVARRLGLGDPEKQGQEFYTHCPFHHDEDPSLRLRRDAGVWFCDVCTVGGDQIKLVQQAHSVSFPEAVRWIAGERTAVAERRVTVS